MGILEFENKLLNNELEVVNNFKITRDYYIEMKIIDIERAFVKTFLLLIIILIILWLI